MEKQTYGAMAVIGPQYCAPCPSDLAIAREVKTLEDGRFVVSDVNGNIMFKVKSKNFSLKWHILDAAGNPLVTLKQKVMTEHSRWNAFRGESTDDKDYLFTVKATSMMQLHTKLAVFLANNTSKEKDCDFMIKGSWPGRSCVIYAGDPSTVVAQMHNKIVHQRLMIGKDNLMVTICPNIDGAFVVCLLVILAEINATNDAILIGTSFGAGFAVVT